MITLTFLFSISNTFYIIHNNKYRITINKNSNNIQNNRNIQNNIIIKKNRYTIKKDKKILLIMVSRLLIILF